MAEDNFTQIRVPKNSRDRLKIRSIKNHRSIPQELDYIIEQVEVMEATGIRKIEVLPGPKGSQRVPVVTIDRGME